MQHRIGTAGLWILNALVLVALIALAGTSLSDGSPVRFAAIAAVLLAGAAIAVFGRDLVLSAELGFAAFVGVLAYSGVRLGTLDAANGAAIGNVPAAVLGSCVLIALLLAALAALVALRRLPVWLRAAIACIVAYALTPIAFEVMRGGGLDVSLAANAPLPGDPFWIRGAYVCAALLLPCGTLASFVASITLMVRKHRQAAARLGAGTLVFALATQMIGLQAAQTGLPGTLAYGSSVRAPQQAAASDVAPMAGAPELTMPAAGDASAVGAALAPSLTSVPAQDAANQVIREAQALRAQDYEVDARSDVLGAGVEPAFDFVRDYVRFESYSGMFRGASGTFTAHAGNAWDRSVLLAHILARKGIKFRFATGHLSPADAELLFNRMFDTATPHGVAKPSAVAAASGQADFTRRIYARASRDFATMRTALGGVANPAALVPSHAELIAEISSHTWVQAQVNGAWVDLDTAFPDAAMGHAFCAVENTYDQVPPEAMQHVTVRVSAETVDNGTLATTTALDVTVPAFQLLDKQVFLYHTASDTNALAGNKDAMIPVLNVNGTDHEGMPVAFGHVPSKVEAMAGGLGAINSGDGSPATAAPAATSMGPEFVAEWLELEVDTPDGKKDITRRTLVDRAGAAWRAASVHDPASLAELPSNANGIVAAQTTYNLCFSGGDHDLAAYFASIALAPHSTDGVPATPPPAKDFADQVLPLAIRDFGWFVVSDHTIVPSLNDSPRMRFYADSPRIFVFAFGTDAKTRAMTLQSDLRRDTLRGVARDASDGNAVLERKMWFGALEGALEHEFGASEIAGRPAESSTFTSTSSLLTHDGVVVVTPGSNADLGSNPETAARLRAALALGDTLIIPRSVLRGGTAGWWQIAGATGDTRAVLGPDLNGGFEIVSGDLPSGGSSSAMGIWDATKTNAQNLEAQAARLRPPAPVDGPTEDLIVLEVELGWYNAVIQFGWTVFAAMSLYAAYYAYNMQITPSYP